MSNMSPRPGTFKDHAPICAVAGTEPAPLATCSPYLRGHTVKFDCKGSSRNKTVKGILTYIS